MATYATVSDFEDYVPDWITDDADALDDVLVQAEHDIDAAVGDYSLEANGLKLGTPGGANEKQLTPGQIIGLTRATCAQAEYRIAMGAEFFVKDQHQSVGGPDFNYSGELDYIGPKARQELDNAGLLRAKRGSRFGSFALTSNTVGAQVSTEAEPSTP